MKSNKIGAQKMKIGVVILLSLAATVTTTTVTETDCTVVTGLLSACSSFISYGAADPVPNSACCDAMRSLNLIAESGDNRRSVCKCFMGLIAAYNPFSTAIGTLPGFCGISLGFVVHPDTDCTALP